MKLDQLKEIAKEKAKKMKLKDFSISSNMQGTEVDVSCYNGQLQFTVTAADLDNEKKSK